MNLILFGKIASSMVRSLCHNPSKLALAVFSSVALLALISWPLLASEPADDGEKSSRRIKITASGTTTPPPKSDTTTPNKPSAEKPSADKPSAENSKSDKAAPAKTGAGKTDSTGLDKSSDKAAAKPAPGGQTKSKAEQDTRGNNRLELDDSSGTDRKNNLRDMGSVKLLSADENDQELSIEAQQKKDQGECPGSEGSKVPTTQNVNDIPLEQDDHPFDAPAAQTDDEPMSEAGDEPAPIKKPVAPSARAQSKADPSVNRLEERINSCLAHYYTHKESLAKRSPWAVMHTILPFGVETDIIAGHRNVNAIGWMCYNGVCKTQRVFQSTKTGFRTNVGPGVQGHEGQFLAILAQSSVPKNFPIVVGKNRYTVSDLIRYEMVTCREKSELTFKLIGLSHYLPANQTWRDDRGHSWNLEKVVREELDQPIVGAACGGTHRLMGLSYALMMRRRYEQPITGHWARADVYINDFIQYAWSLQNPDGSFSTEWFEGRANEPNMERKVQTTGHILEWLIFTLPADQLDDPRVTKSIEFLLSQVYDNREKDWPIGPRGHSLRAISLYNQRVFGAPTGQLKSHLAQAGYMKDLR